MNNPMHQAIVPMVDFSDLFFDQAGWLHPGIASMVNNVEFMMANLSFTQSLTQPLTLPLPGSLTLKWSETIKHKAIL